MATVSTLGSWKRLAISYPISTGLKASRFGSNHSPNHPTNHKNHMPFRTIKFSNLCDIVWKPESIRSGCACCNLVLPWSGLARLGSTHDGLGHAESYDG